jgi:hypothetical protein
MQIKNHHDRSIDHPRHEPPVKKFEKIGFCALSALSPGVASIGQDDHVGTSQVLRNSGSVTNIADCHVVTSHRPMVNVTKTSDAATGSPAPPLQHIVAQSATCLICVSTLVTNDEPYVVAIAPVHVRISSLELFPERPKVRSCERIPAQAIAIWPRTTTIGAPMFIAELQPSAPINPDHI